MFKSLINSYFVQNKIIPRQLNQNKMRFTNILNLDKKCHKILNPLQINEVVKLIPKIF